MIPDRTHTLPRRRVGLTRDRRHLLVPLAALGVAALHLGMAVGMGPATGPAATDDVADLRAAYARPVAEWPAASWDEALPAAQRRDLGPVPDVVFPADNPYSAAKAALGKKLFWDPRLSGSSFVACVSCHHPDLGWADGKTVSQGHQLVELKRNAPTILGTALQPVLMWDGRADSLEDQALLPLVDDKEMHGAFGKVEESLNAIPEYRAEFGRAFGQEQVSIDLVVKALATFQRTLVPGQAKFDAFLRGRSASLSDAQLRGLHLFRTKARCINCHGGPLLSDGAFHNTGLSQRGRAFEDLGRYVETRDVSDVGKFRTPTLRNVGRTAPYMHNGLFELDVLVRLYDSGMPNERGDGPNDPLAPKKSPLLRKLNLTPGEREDLVAFMTDALDEPKNRVRPPKLPGLYGDATTRPGQ